MGVDQNKNIDNLLFLLVENALDKEGTEYVERWLSSSEQAKRYYLDFIKDYAAMKSHANSVIDLDESSFPIHDEHDAELWSALAEMEKEAETVEEVKVVPDPRPVIQTVNPQEKPRTVSRLSVITIAVSAAAVLLFGIFLRLSPYPYVEVATLSVNHDAVFGSNNHYQVGSRLSNGTEPLWLKKGIITVDFDYGAQVVIEGPAEFSLDSGEGMTLYYGRLYAQVPGRSIGFTVQTPMAQIIDLGTEFGVKVDSDRACEVHMIKGKASLVPGGSKGQANGDSQILVANEARNVSLSGEVKTIPVKATDFIRRVDPATGFIWRGHKSVDLADIVGRGNGFGTGKLEYGINPKTGVSAYRDRDQVTDSFYQGFTPVKDNPLVDGVFCPFKDSNAIQVSTAGHKFDQCPSTTGTHWGNVMNSGWYGQTSRSKDAFKDNLQLNGQTYGSKEFPAIAIHSNMGVTFDLEAIRRSVRPFKIDRLSAHCGISDLVIEESGFSFEPKASFYVLLDGQKQFERVDISPTDQAAEIDIEIPKNARFLTFVVTEGSDRTYDGDWTLFANPKLELTRVE